MPKSKKSSSTGSRKPTDSCANKKPSATNKVSVTNKPLATDKAPATHKTSGIKKASRAKMVPGTNNISSTPQISGQNSETRSTVELPAEVWDLICDYLYPSQLIRLSKVNSDTRKVVCSRRLWNILFRRFYGDESTVAVLPGFSKAHSTMLLICAISPKICEQCLKHCGTERENLAEMPLPAFAPSQTRSTEKARCLGEPIDFTFEVHLCLDCRKALFQAVPMTVPLEIQKKAMTIEQARKMYPKAGIPERPTPDMKKLDGHFRQGMFLKMARKTLGGDVGVKAAHFTSLENDEYTESRYREYMDLHRELTKTK
ncbi:hypothetical protein BGZ83_006489 [Gryganskiella cystojenkinii]|nr:hypothetical protein BGZ83_006489 [Gryganskiella cystojenkinii]